MCKFLFSVNIFKRNSFQKKSDLTAILLPKAPGTVLRNVNSAQLCIPREFLDSSIH